MGRVRDDFDNWFGNDNSTLLWHYPLPDQYVRRNPHVAYPDPRVNVTAVAADVRTLTSTTKHGTRSGESQSLLTSAATDPNQLFPISRTLERFNDPSHANRVTGACGPAIYRDDLLGTNYYGNAFICEPVNNLVTRLVLEPNGVTFAGHRAPGEERSEFLASTDNWFRPVQARTGPDGALWIVDMYRFVIEHPRWIPTNRLAQLDVRAGADMGRIYRVYPRGANLRPVRDLTRMNDAELAEAMNTSNGQVRDLAHHELLQRRAGVSPAQAARDPRKTVETSVLLSDYATNSPDPAVRAQVLCALAGLQSLAPEVLLRAIKDADLRIRRVGLRLGEASLGAGNFSPSLTDAVLSLTDASDPAVRFQLALTLGEWNDPRAGDALVKLARNDDRWVRAAVLSSAPTHFASILSRVREWPVSTPARSEFIVQLCALAVASGEASQIQHALDAIAPDPANAPDTSWYESLAALLDAMERRSVALNSVLVGSTTGRRVREVLANARVHATNAADDEVLRERSIRLLARRGSESNGDVPLLCGLLLPPASPRLQNAALDRLRSQRAHDIALDMLAQWTRYSTALRPRIVTVLVDREDWASELLAALKVGTVSPSEISPGDQQRLLKRGSAELRTNTASLFRRAGTRSDVLAKYEEVSSLAGAPDRGAAVFDKTCAQCHAYRGRGHVVGPNLAEFAGKSAQDFLVAILDPNAAINPGFIAYNVETKDGRGLSGIVRGETAGSLTLVQGGGVEEGILRDDITAIRASDLSLMPEALEQAITPQDMADLIAWIKKSAPLPFGGASVEQASKARAKFLKSGLNGLALGSPSPTRAEASPLTAASWSTSPSATFACCVWSALHGLAGIVTCAERLPYPSWMGRLPMPYCRQSEGQNRLEWRTAPVSIPGAAGRPETNITATGVVAFRLAAAMGFVSQPPGKFTLSLNGKIALEFDVSLTDRTWASTDGRVRMDYTVMENNSEDSNGVLVIEVAADLLAPGRPATIEVLGSPSNSHRWFGVYLAAE
jgi:putative heme-binding domain-containing protein